MSENKGMKSECKKFEENSRETASVTSIVVMFELTSNYTTMQ